MLRHIGLSAGAMKGNLDRLYIERLLALVRGSSLGAAVIQAHDDVHGEQGRVMVGVGSFYVPNDYVLALARKHSEFLPAVSIHPARGDALEELDRCVAAGAVMMKCLPNCQNIDCNDRRFTKFWERMAELKLPLIAHTGGEHTLPVVRPEFANPRADLAAGMWGHGHRGAQRDEDRFVRLRIFSRFRRADGALPESVWRHQCLQCADPRAARGGMPA